MREGVAWDGVGVPPSRARRPTRPHSPSPSPSPSTPSPPPSRPPKPFGFRKFKGHKHDKVAAAKRAATEVALEGMPAAIAEYRARRAAHGASPLEALLSRPSELKKRVGRAAVQAGSPKKG